MENNGGGGGGGGMDGRPLAFVRTETANGPMYGILRSEQGPNGHVGMRVIPTTAPAGGPGTSWNVNGNYSAVNHPPPGNGIQQQSVSMGGSNGIYMPLGTGFGNGSQQPQQQLGYSGMGWGMTYSSSYSVPGNPYPSPPSDGQTTNEMFPFNNGNAGTSGMDFGTRATVTSSSGRGRATTSTTTTTKKPRAASKGRGRGKAGCSMPPNVEVIPGLSPATLNMGYGSSYFQQSMGTSTSSTGSSAYYQPPAPNLPAIPGPSSGMDWTTGFQNAPVISQYQQHPAQNVPDFGAAIAGPAQQPPISNPAQNYPQSGVPVPNSRTISSQQVVALLRGQLRSTQALLSEEKKASEEKALQYKAEVELLRETMSRMEYDHAQELDRLKSQEKRRQSSQSGKDTEKLRRIEDSLKELLAKVVKWEDQELDLNLRIDTVSPSAGPSDHVADDEKTSPELVFENVLKTITKVGNIIDALKTGPNWLLNFLSEQPASGLDLTLGENNGNRMEAMRKDNFKAIDGTHPLPFWDDDNWLGMGGALGLNLWEESVREVKLLEAAQRKEKAESAVKNELDHGTEQVEQAASASQSAAPDPATESAVSPAIELEDSSDDKMKMVEISKTIHQLQMVPLLQSASQPLHPPPRPLPSPGRKKQFPAPMNVLHPKSKKIKQEKSKPTPGSSGAGKNRGRSFIGMQKKGMKLSPEGSGQYPLLLCINCGKKFLFLKTYEQHEKSCKANLDRTY